MEQNNQGRGPAPISRPLVHGQLQAVEHVVQKWMEVFEAPVLGYDQDALKQNDHILARRQLRAFLSELSLVARNLETIVDILSQQLEL